MSQEEAHFSMQSVHTSSRQGIRSRAATAARESLSVCVCCSSADASSLYGCSRASLSLLRRPSCVAPASLASHPHAFLASKMRATD